jgi:hypothetical protein
MKYDLSNKQTAFIPNMQEVKNSRNKVIRNTIHNNQYINIQLIKVLPPHCKTQTIQKANGPLLNNPK